MEIQKILNFFFEMGQLKRIKHEGWRLAGITDLDSVGEHSLRAAQIGYILAKLEGYADPNEVTSILVFHDIGETRIGDLHKVASRYVEADEERAVSEQLESLGTIKEDIFSLWKQMEDRSTPAGIVAKDADYLEQAVTAKEYLEKGYTFAQDWINNVAKAVKTESAKKLVQELQNSNSNAWWQGLKNLTKDISGQK
jgi:putative hydrolases of HD superfamily